MAKIGVHFLVLFFGLVYNFYKWLYFLLLVDCSHYGCHPSMKVVPQFFPVARNFLLRAFSRCCFVSIQFYRIGFGSLRRKAVDLKGQSGTRLKNSIWNLSIFVSSKNVSNLRLSALPCSSSLRFGGEVVLMVTPLVPWPFSYKRDLSRASQTFMNKGK